MGLSAMSTAEIHRLKPVAIIPFVPLALRIADNER